jgi:hypothetical protein
MTIEQKTYLVEITAGWGWYEKRIGERFICTRDMAGSKGLAPWRVANEPPVVIFDVANCVSMACTHYIRLQDSKLIED